jgi:hypothetical protein
MNACEWGKGGCWQSPPRGQRYCYYHQKVGAGLIGGPEKKPESRVSPAAVVSDEQVQIAQVLRAMGAPRQAIRQALGKHRKLPR